MGKKLMIAWEIGNGLTREVVFEFRELLNIF